MNFVEVRKKENLNIKSMVNNLNAAKNILKEGLKILNSAGTVDYTDGEDRRPNLLKGHSSVKSEAHESLVRG
jgi:putative transposase